MLALMFVCAHTHTHHVCVCVCARARAHMRVHIHVVVVVEIFLLSKYNDISGNQLHEYRNSNTSLFIIMDCCDDWHKLIDISRYFSSPQTCKLALGTTKLPVCGYQVYFLWVKWMVCEVDRSPPSSAEFKNKLSHSSAPSACLHGADSDNFSFYVFHLV